MATYDAIDVLFPARDDGSTAATATPGLPAVSSAVPTAANVVRVTFSRVMREEPDLVDPTRYVFTGGLTAVEVTRVDARTVDVRVTPDMTADALHQLTVTGP